MEVFFSLEDYPYSGTVSATIGTFDGVHLGHRCLLEALDRLACERNYKRLLITFSDRPTSFFKQDVTDASLVLSLDEKIEMLRGTGLVDVLFVFRFRDVYGYSFDHFVRKILLDKLRVGLLVMGYNNHIGRDREGHFESVRKVIPTFRLDTSRSLDGEGISSTKIRDRILKGDFSRAFKMLGYPYFISGAVVRGRAVGRHLGFPTANVSIPITKILPPDGVYVAKIYLGSASYRGVLNLGRRPTIDVSGARILEVHILNFSQEIYGAILKIEPVKYLRSERKFKSLESLKDQIRRDIALSLTIGETDYL